MSNVKVPTLPPPDTRERSRQPRVQSFVLSVLLLFFTVGFIGPVALMIINTFREYERGVGFGGPSLANFVRVLTDGTILAAFLNTGLMAILVVALCILIAYPIGLLFIRSSRRVRTVILVLVLGPLLVNAVVRTFGWIILFSPGGAFDSLTGVTLYHTEIAVVLAMLHLFVAYMVLSLLTSLSSIPTDLVPAAHALGASSWFTFRHVVFPLSVPGLVSGSIIVFGLAAGSVITPLLLGGSTIQLITVVIYRQMLVFFDPSIAATLASLLLVVNVLAIFAGERLARRFAGFQFGSKESLT